MKYTFYKNKETIAIFYDAQQVKKFIKLQRYEDNPSSNQGDNQWYIVFQEKKLIGYFSNLKYASELLEGEFKSRKIEEKDNKTLKTTL